MQGLNKKMRGLTTSASLLFGIAVGSLFWGHAACDTAKTPTPVVADHIAASAAFITRTTFEAPKTEHEQGKPCQCDRQYRVAALPQAEMAVLRQPPAAIAPLHAETAVALPNLPAQDLAERIETAQNLEPQADAQVQAQMAAMEDTFNREQVDSAWAHAAELALREVLQHDDVTALAFVDVECRTTLCRLELAGNSAPEGDTTFVESFRELMHLISWAGQSFGLIDMVEDKSPTGVLYLTRDGQVFPPAIEQQ